MEEAALEKERELDQCKVCSYPVCMYAELPLMSGLWATDLWWYIVHVYFVTMLMSISFSM